MIQSRLSRSDELGSRIDSPMREEIRPAQGSTTSVSSLLSPPLEHSPTGQTIKITYNMSHEKPTSGFTAVNGDAQRNTSFRPGDSVNRSNSSTSQFERKEGAPEHAGTPHQVHNWRPDERSTTLPGGSDRSPPNKRKRIESEKDDSSSRGYENRLGAAEHESLQRSASTANTIVTTPAATAAPEQTAAPATVDHARERAMSGRYEREPTPIFMKDRGAPPPPPRPEVVAGLAESLKRELATAQDNQQYVSPGVSDTDRHVMAAERSTSPADESYDHQQSPPYESEHGHNGDGEESSSKKRKRNFSNRTKTGCHTCRARKKKCDENKPVCHNCTRGGFDCGGYGPKPPGGTKVSAARPLTAIKPAYEPSHGPSQFSVAPYYDNRPRQPQPPYDQPTYDQPTYGPPVPPRSDPHSLPPVHHYNHPHPHPHPHVPPPPVEFRPRDGYTMPYPELPHYADRFPPHGLPPPPPPPADYGALPPYRTYSDPKHPSHHRTPSLPTAPLAPPTLPRYGPLDQYHGPPGPPTTISSKDSGISSHSSGHRSRPGLVYRSGEKIGRSKMITGEPCAYFTDKALINERSSCKEILERYNEADKTNSGVHMDQKGLIFSQLVNPKERSDYGHSWDGPIGSIGDRVVVQAPFSCEYGYNLHFGDETMIMRNCYFQDAATISIGSHVSIGPGCHLLTLVSPTSSGSQGLHSTGAIRIEDGCTIGGNVTILPFRTIGKGARVIAGSVVTKDVKPNSVVAGNPAKPLREVDEVVEKENAKALKEMQNGTWRREKFL